MIVLDLWERFDLWGVENEKVGCIFGGFLEGVKVKEFLC